MKDQSSIMRCRVCGSGYWPNHHNVKIGMGKYYSRKCSGMASRSREALFIMDGCRVVRGVKGYLFILGPNDRKEVLLQKNRLKKGLPVRTAEC